MKPRRRATWIGGGLLAAAVLGLVWAEVKGWPFLRQPLERALARHAGVPVELQGRFRVHWLWRPRLEVEQMRVGADESFHVPYLLDAQRLTLGWQWADLWRWRQSGTLRVQTLQAGVLRAHLIRESDGRATWQLGARPAARPVEELSSPALDLPAFGLLAVDEGHIDVNDHLLDAVLQVDLHGREGDALPGTSAGYAATISGRYRAMPLKLQVQAGNTLPLLKDSAADAEEAGVPLRVEGQVASSSVLFDGQAAALAGASSLQGRLHFQGPSLASVGEPLGITLPQTPPFDLRGELRQKAGVWQLQVQQATMGSSRLAGELRYDSRTRPPQLSGRVSGPRLAFADLGPAIGTSPASANPPGAAGTTTQRVLPQRHFDLPSLKAMNADVQMDIDTLDFGTPAMEPLKQLRTQVNLQGGTLQLKALQAQVAAGQFKGRMQFDAPAGTARWQASLQFTDIDVAGWLRGLRSAEGRAAAPASTNASALRARREQARQGATDGSPRLQAYLTGVLDGSLEVSGTGRSTAEILGTLEGQAQLLLRNGTLSHLATELMGLDVAQALGVAIQGDEPLPLRCARLDLVSHTGVIQPRLAVVDNRDSTVWVTGAVNLRDESLALRVVTQPKDWSPLSLRSPLAIGGQLGAPQVSIESKPLAGRVLSAIALGTLFTPVAALLPLIDRGEAPTNDPCLRLPKTERPRRADAAASSARKYP